MIRLDQVSKVFQPKKGLFSFLPWQRKSAPAVVAVKNVSLHIPEGQIFGIIGSSGAGKSTLVRMINCLERPSQGQVMVAGQNMTSLPTSQLRQARRQIGMIFQSFCLMKLRTVHANIAYPLEIAGWNRTDIEARVTELLQLVGLADKAQAYPEQLSGGQKQRVAIARAIANRPKVLLCDEATSALDPETTRSILNLLQTINQKEKITMVIITHEMSVVRQICHQVAVMAEGQVVESGPVDSVFAHPSHPTTLRLLGLVKEDADLPAACDSADASKATDCCQLKEVTV